MITGTLKSKVDEIWNAFHSNGITDPLTTIQQITYLLFIRRLDEEQLRMEKQANRTGKSIEKFIYTPEQKDIRWHQFKELEPKQMLEVFTERDAKKRPVTAFEFIRMVGGEQSQISRFFKDSTFVISSAYLLDKAVQMIDKIDMQDRDTKGDLYEYLLSKLTQAGRAGQFRTPRHIIRMMVDMVKPTSEDTICDPSAGTSGFLVSAGEYLRDTHPDKFLEKEFLDFFNNEMFTGIEFDQNMMRVGAMNLILHGVEHPNLMHVNALSDENEVSDHFSLMLANPPFKGTLDSELLTRSGKVNFQGVLGVNKKVVNWLKNSYSYANADANLP
jgi:type I restriction enzyme M protein